MAASTTLSHTTTMPCESSLPLDLASIALAAISIFAWMRTAARPWLAIAILAACTPLAAFVDPELRPLRAEAEKVLKQVRPTKVAITKLDVSLDSPEAAIVTNSRQSGGRP